MRDLFKKFLQYVAFALLILLALGSFAGKDWAGGFIFLVSGIIVLPSIRLRLAHTPLKSGKATAIIVIVASLIAMNLGMRSDEKAHAQKEQARLDKMDLAREEAIQRDKEDFAANPELVLKDISELIEKKDFSEAKRKAERLLDLKDEQIKVLYEKANEAHEKDEANQRKIALENQYTSSWDVSRDISAMDDTPSIFLTKEAINMVSAWPKDVRPALSIRCKEKKTEVIFVANTHFTPVYGEYNKASIRYRLDDGAAVQQLWSESTNGEAAFVPHAIGFLKKTKNAQILKIEFESFNVGSAVAEFDLRGLGAHLEELSNICQWQL